MIRKFKVKFPRKWFPFGQAAAAYQAITRSRIGLIQVYPISMARTGASCRCGCTADTPRWADIPRSHREPSPFDSISRGPSEPTACYRPLRWTGSKGW